MDLSTLFDSALRLEDEHKYKQAVDCYEQCLALAEAQSLPRNHPGLLATQNNLASLLLTDSFVAASARARGKLDRAKSLYRSTLTEDAQNHVALLGLARCAFEEKEYDQAAELFRRVVDLLEPQLQARPADAETDTDADADAGEKEQDRRDLDEHLSLTYEGLGLTLLAKDDYAAAEPHLRRALERAQRPELFLGSMFGLAQICLRDGRFKETIKYGRLAHQHARPGDASVDPSLYYLLAIAFEKEGLEADAAQSFAMGKRLHSARVPVPAWIETMLYHRFHPRSLAPDKKDHPPPSRALLAVVVAIIVCSLIGLAWLLQFVSIEQMLRPARD